MVIGKGGILVFPRYSEELAEAEPPRALEASRLPSGIPGLDALIGDGLLKRSATILAGSPGIGKSTFGIQFVLEGAARKEPALIVTLEEGPQQLLATADALNLPLRKWVERSLVEIIYLSHEHVQAAQLLSVLGDKIRSRKARRVFLDSATHISREGMPPDQLRQILYKLVARFKTLDVTSLLAVESTSLYFGDDVTERGFSPVADNLLMLRYVATEDALLPALRVVKTRGSAHDRGTYAVILGNEGMRIGDRMVGSARTSPTQRSSTRKASRKKERPR